MNMEFAPCIMRLFWDSMSVGKYSYICGWVIAYTDEEVLSNAKKPPFSTTFSVTIEISFLCSRKLASIQTSPVWGYSLNISWNRTSLWDQSWAMESKLLNNWCLTWTMRGFHEYSRRFMACGGYLLKSNWRYSTLHHVFTCNCSNG